MADLEKSATRGRFPNPPSPTPFPGRLGNLPHLVRCRRNAPNHDALHTCALLVLAVLLTAWLGAPDSAGAQVRAEAFVGAPFGVGRAEVDLPPEMLPEVLGLRGLGLAEKSGRALYPAVGEKVVRGLLRGLLDRPRTATVYFLFQGDDPLELTVQSRAAHTVVVSPRVDPASYDRLLRAWWREYTSGPRLLEKKPDYPPLVENYLQSMLAPRLGLPVPQEKTDQSWRAQLKQYLGLALGTESIRIAIERERMRGGRAFDEPADQPLPKPLALPDLTVPEPDPKVQVDPIAMRVPVECLYVRFGRFSNFLWLQDTLERWGGDLRNLVASRGLDYGLRRRIESQLVLRQTAMARLLGDTVVADVAIIGTDVFFQEGAAFGILFHTRQNNIFLAAEIKRQRLERTRAGDGATEKKITIAGHELSMLSAPDGSVRSYYVADGQFHLVTTSKTLARRFLETGSGKEALGASREFRHARTLMPMDRGDTVFVYLSDAFLQNVISPHFRVETARRLQALADLELVELALLASATEGKPGQTIEQLIRGGFLPPGFGPRSDGSRTVLEDGEVYDSLRGRRGQFLPVPDVEVGRVSRSEADGFRQFCDAYLAKWERLDPISVAIKRQAMADDRERIVLDARLSPFAAEHIPLLKEFAGPPDKMRFAPVPGDVVAVEMLFPRQRLFAGLQDFRPPVELLGGLVLPVGRLRDTLVGYVGSVGDLGLLSLLGNRFVGPPDAGGYTAGLGGLWRHQSDEFTVFSFQRDLLAEVVPQLRLEETQRPAQLRLRVEDLSSGRMASLLNKMGYARTRETSLGNVRLMESLAQQLHVPGEHCKEAAELLLDAELVCPLGGRYVYRRTPDGIGFWTSTALDAGRRRGLLASQIPPGYQAPPLNWFRGLDLDVLLTPDVLSAHAEIVMQKPAKSK